MSEGNEGRFQPTIIDGGALSELRDVAGPPPIDGKHWVMVDLMTGQLKWYKSIRKRYSNYRRGYTRRRY